MAHLGIRARVLICGDGPGEAVGVVAESLPAEADGDPLEHERRQRGAPAVADSPDDGVAVERDIVEEDLVELGLSGDLRAPNCDSGGIHRHDEHGQALVLGNVGICTREQQSVGGELRVRRPHLLAAETPAAVVGESRTGLHRREIGSGGGLGEELAPDLIAVEHRPEIARLLGIGAMGDDRRPEHADADRIEDAGHARAADLLAADHLLDRPSPCPPYSLGQVTPARPPSASLPCHARRALISSSSSEIASGPSRTGASAECSFSQARTCAR